MKKILQTSVLIIIITQIAFSVNPDLSANTKAIDPAAKENATAWMQKQPVKFLENRGQMADMDGKPVPFVLFKAEAPGVDMYITEKGLTYVFKKITKEEVKEEEQTEGDKIEEPIFKSLSMLEIFLRSFIIFP